MGDSYSAGPLIPTTNLAGGCARSDHNYPSLVAQRLGVHTLVDATCSGASSADVTQVQRTFGDARIPPQISHLKPDTDLVTIGIGGNDLDLFTTLVRLCTRLGASDPSGSPCTRQLAARHVDLDSVTRVISRHVAASLREIKRRAPNATVLLVGYLRLVPDAGTCPALPLAAGDYPEGRRIGEALAQAQRRAARATGVRFVDMYAASRGHDICSADPWVNGKVTIRAKALSYHPFESGMRADAEQVLRALRTP
jgi:lysophospholipase L1-like esterase